MALAPTNASQGQWIRLVGTLGEMAKQLGNEGPGEWNCHLCRGGWRRVSFLLTLRKYCQGQDEGNPRIEIASGSFQPL